MYQYTWVDDKYIKEHLGIVPEKGMDGLIMPEDIEMIRLIYWGEHCMECAVPLCYHNCEEWHERYDQKCRRFYYGIYDNPNFPQFANAAQLKFHNWGKLWSNIYRCVVPVREEKKMDYHNKVISRGIRCVSKCMKKISPTCKLNGAWEYWVKRCLGKKNAEGNTNQFLLQIYSDDVNEFNIMVDIQSKLGLRFREAVSIKKGYNQALLNVEQKFSFDEEQLNISIYPENDFNAEIVILMASFVSLKEGIKEREYQQAPKVKCVAWDLDNTLWNGTLIESNPNMLQLRAGVLKTIKELDARGIIQVVVSKNDEDDALPVMERLGIKDYFVATAINWSSKSENIKKLARMLNINVNTFAFIDDSIFERNEVGQSLPQVRIYEEKDIEGLLEKEEFHIRITKDGEKRRQMYQTEFQRKKIEEESGEDLISFLKSCELEAMISHPDTEEKLERSYELLQRTNQLNLSGCKYEREEFLEGVKARPEDSYVVSVKDKYGQYGQVLYFVVQEHAELRIKEFAMSCRVAGKCIESALLHWLRRKYGEKEIVFEGVNNQKNSLLIRTLQGIGMENRSQGERLVLCLKKDISLENCEIVKVEEKYSDRE